MESRTSCIGNFNKAFLVQAKHLLVHHYDWMSSELVTLLVCELTKRTSERRERWTERAFLQMTYTTVGEYVERCFLDRATFPCTNIYDYQLLFRIQLADRADALQSKKQFRAWLIKFLTWLYHQAKEQHELTVHT